MESLETRDKFRFTTRFRVLPKNFGDYGGERVFDIEEIVVATDTLPFEDYVECRQHHLTFSVFWNDSWFSDVVAFAEQFGRLDLGDLERYGEQLATGAPVLLVISP